MVIVILLGLRSVRWGIRLSSFVVVASILVRILAAAASRKAGDQPGCGQKEGKAFTGHGSEDRLRWNRCRTAGSLRGRQGEWLASQRDIAVIHLTRRNLLRYYVSLSIARQTAMWISPSRKRARSAAPTLRIDPRDAEAVFTHRLARNTASRLAYAQHPMLEMTYEALEAAPQTEFSRVQGFLGLTARPLEIITAQQEQRRLPEIIENYDELGRRWRGTPWGEFLED